MGSIKWYKRDPDAALQGMFELSLEERGAYNTVLDLIYAKANKLPDDDRFVAGWMRVDVRVWRRIKLRLIALRKLRVDAGFLRNGRADVEVDRAILRGLSASDAGRASAAKRWGKSDTKPNGTNVIAITAATTDVSTDLMLNQNKRREKKEEKEKEPIGSKKKVPWREGDPIPAAWIEWAEKNMRWPEVVARREANRFIDYSLANGRSYVNWMAGWRGWCTGPFQKTPKGGDQPKLQL